LKKTNLNILLSLLICFLARQTYATHIVGGEIYYDNLGGGNYKITMKVYRDCFNGVPALDNPAFMTVYDASNNVIMTFDMPLISNTNISPSINNPCIQPPNGVCVEEGIYEHTINLPPKTGGYYIVYQRCCRNGTILNLVNPGNLGATYFEHIPGPEVVAVNNSPRFKKFPPIFICNGIKIAFDHSATDPDGDQLVYSLYHPYNGLSPCCPIISNPPPGVGSCANPPPVCPSVNTPPPYTGVPFVAPYSGSYPLASSPAINVNPVTGFLDGIPNINGQWVVGVCVQEFRAGNLIGTHYREFQFNVVDCIVTVVSQFNDQSTPIGSLPNQFCIGKTINFINYSIGGNQFHWDFGVNGTLADTSVLINPSYTYPDTGRYEVSLIANPGTPCCDTSISTFYVYPELNPAFVAPGPQCVNNNSFNFTVGGVYASYATFYWIFGTSATPQNATVSSPTNIVYSAPGKYPVFVDVKQNICKKTLKDTIQVFQIPTANFSTDSMKGCDPTTVTFENTSAADGSVSYYWSFSDGAHSTDKNPTHTFSPAGVYDATLSIITTSVCIDTSDFVVPGIVTVWQRPEAHFDYTPDSVTIFDADIFFINESMYSSGWTWDFGDGNGSVTPNPVHHYSNYGDFTVTLGATNEAGCADTSVQIITILPEFKFWVPNCFTPGKADGLNDVFTPIVICAEDYEFNVYDRWGERLFKTNVAGEGWNGFYKGKLCEQDVYVWYIKFKNGETRRREEHYGHVTLLR
jgi:gliding motility-associated-like protein